jgi:hypothetical protein
MARGAGVRTTKLRPLPVRIGRALATSVTVAATVVGLLFLLWPELQPESPPTRKGAELSDVTLDRNATFAQYLDRLEQSRAPFQRAELRRRGVLIGLRFRVQGYKGMHLPLRWQLINARTGSQVAQSQDLFYIPKAEEDQNAWSVWVPVPSSSRRVFFVEIELRDDRHNFPLGRLRTHRFHGT